MPLVVMPCTPGASLTRCMLVQVAAVANKPPHTNATCCDAVYTWSPTHQVYAGVDAAGRSSKKPPHTNATCCDAVYTWSLTHQVYAGAGGSSSEQTAPHECHLL
ncbi:hypothetical protein O0L34_g5664 [Tuta absoluta]|nr:hypothetical protein O0L34_g5664 [Tuta absoluta]